MGLMLALALIMSYVEVLIPIPFTVPGMKLGLPNLVVVLVLYQYGPGWALGINLMRIVISGFAFGGLSAILFSLAGAGLSYLCMLLLKKTGHFGITGVSVIGGVTHNIGQLICAALIVKTFGVAFLIAPLMIAGCITGLALGAVATILQPVLRRMAS